NFEQNNAGQTIFKVGNDWYAVTMATAGAISISTEISQDLNKIAAGKNPLPGPGDGSNALLLLQQRQDLGMFTWGNPDDFFKSLVSNLGVDTQEAIRMTDNQMVLSNQIDNNRQSIS